MKPTIPLLILLLAFVPFESPAGLAERDWQIDGVKRQALVWTPEQKPSNPAGYPLVFAFHGHGGSMRNAARAFSIHTKWPGAVVVYMQGLDTPGRLTDPLGRLPGWQTGIGDQGDRDLKFFDAVLASVEKDLPIDKTRVYCTGHSNGGSFTYLLWAARGDIFAAVAPSAAVDGKDLRRFKPKPVLHLAGDSDPLVKFDWQREMIDALRKLNHCTDGKPWDDEEGCTIYESPGGTPVVAAIHKGGHRFDAKEPELIIKFFKEHTLPAKNQGKRLAG
ncbi:MAG TPA: prolyl oligopeptidase family serine peptidase [Verrucomicrobiae bacterium]|nr:prolyl oligopeptidase family serine peptidase [Verrucomicrobiae bacterium]